MTTKTDLEKENSELRITHNNLFEQDVRIRKEFAKALQLTKPSYGYSSETEYRLPSWNEVFTELGRLLANQQQSYLEDEIKVIKRELHRLNEVEKVKDVAPQKE